MVELPLLPTFIGCKVLALSEVGRKTFTSCMLPFFFIKDLWNALGRLVGGLQDKNKEKKNHYYLLLW
jgi:hypothetical protein